MVYQLQIVFIPYFSHFPLILIGYIYKEQYLGNVVVLMVHILGKLYSDRSSFD